MALCTTAMEETRKRQQGLIYEGEETAETKKVRGVAVSASAADGGDLGEDILAWLTMDDEAMTEVIQCLQVTNNNKEEEGASSSSSSSSPTARGSEVKFIDNPYSSPVIFQSSCGYITINGNEESCGSSFSEWDSSVMASVDTGGIGSLGSNGGVGGGAWETDGVMARGGGGGMMMMDGYDGSDWVVDDDCLAWVLGEEDCFDQ